ncbi:MAG: NAD-dependent epimerase/dehydratase family protein [Algoriphagus sp.]|uniref:NAD-dependent epimerase/dehydratase family protein n=1 Tax=Algoriphagus sp. TaxID=1872435 RepID=UPI001854036E|nr:NAD-dependent epimerase/dehydratase family protein [Algoriphagus sp.]NVJ86001.1 NAD-dependent epimerase/dehydratase family protein [Algoriphagus sp.]
MNKILITGIAGFVGSRLATFFKEHDSSIQIIGIDNLSRRGSETNLHLLKQLGCTFVHGDIRSKEDIEELPKVDWVIDCAAIPTVTAGLLGGTRQMIDHNLTGTLNLLEKCRRDTSGFIILSTSRVYSIPALASLPLEEGDTRYQLSVDKGLVGCSSRGIDHNFSTQAPVSLYGATKLASETMALEYGEAFGFPVWINRCGVIAGAGQFGKIDQGIFSFWIYQWLLKKPLAYIGFGGTGKQVRDFFSPQDLAQLLLKQIKDPNRKVPKILNVGGGLDSSMSLFELSQFCREHLNHDIELGRVPETRSFDIPWYVTDNTLVSQYWGWQPMESKESLLQSIMEYARENKSIINNGF